VIFHPRDYKRLRDMAVLRIELGDRAWQLLAGDANWLAIPAMFRELAR